MTTYRVTCRPVVSESVPRGWSALRPLTVPTQWNFGEVEYPEALPQERAEHFSLIPVGPSLESVTVDGVEYQPGELLRHDRSTVYAVACGTKPRQALEAVLLAMAADYEVAVSWVWKP